MTVNKEIRPEVPVYKAQIGSLLTRCVDARTLHTELGNKTEFSKWISRKLEEHMFEEGIDFSPYLTKSTGGRPAHEYHITVNLAKELCMLENTPVGRQFRLYFIECERKLQRALSITPTQAKLLKGEIEDCIKKLKNANNQHDVVFYKEYLEFYFNQLQMHQPPLDLLDEKIEKDK
ncbi:antA/AntB antirepressor family protein [Vibrio sp. PP-XX7]